MLIFDIIHDCSSLNNLTFLIPPNFDIFVEISTLVFLVSRLLHSIECVETYDNDSIGILKIQNLI